MDWSRIKSILIVALILANLALGYEVYRQQGLFFQGTYTEAFDKKVLSLLGKEGIKVDPGIKLQAQSLNSLRVQYQALAEEQLNRDFFHNEALVKQTSLMESVLTYNQESLTVRENRSLAYRNQLPLAQEPINRREALDRVMHFLAERKFQTSDLRLVWSQPWNKGYQFTFKKSYQGKIVETSYSTFSVDQEGIHTFDRLWLDILEPSEREILMESPEKALLSLLDKQEAKNRKVVSLEPCYYFNPSKQGYIEDISRAQQGRAIPAWRIQLDHGEEIVVDILS